MHYRNVSCIFSTSTFYLRPPQLRITSDNIDRSQFFVRSALFEWCTWEIHEKLYWLLHNEQSYWVKNCLRHSAWAKENINTNVAWAEERAWPLRRRRCFGSKTRKEIIAPSRSISQRTSKCWLNWGNNDHRGQAKNHSHRERTVFSIRFDLSARASYRFSTHQTNIFLTKDEIVCTYPDAKT